MKKLLSILLALALLCALGLNLLPTAAAEDNRAPLSGACGVHLNWSYDKSSKLLTITGYGEMSDYEECGPWKAYAGQIKNVSFPSGITYIGANAFSECTVLTAVSLPEGVVGVGEGAFFFCSSIASLSLPESLKTIASNAFAFCDALKSVVLPKNLTKVDWNAFNGCETLKTVVIRCPKCWVASEGIEDGYPVYYDGTLGRPEITILYGKHNESLMNASPTPFIESEYRKIFLRYPEGYALQNGFSYYVTDAFRDVADGKYYEIPVAWAVGKGVTGGTGTGKFSPGKTCTREQVVTFLWAAAGKPAAETLECPFPDVKQSKYYYTAVLWACENGITGGMNDGNFGVGKPCTRAQVMTFLWKFMGSPSPVSSSCPFPDVKKGKYYYDAVLWAYENGITGGMANGTFGVSKTCTRAQVVTFLYGCYLLQPV